MRKLYGLLTMGNQQPSLLYYIGKGRYMKYYGNGYLDESWVMITNDIVQNVKENYYIISNYGNVSNIRYGYDHFDIYSVKFCGQFKNRPYVNLSGNNGKNLIISVARIVAKAFVPGYSDGLEVNHKDGNPNNNYYQNLEWVTRSLNIQHAYETGLIQTSLYDDIVIEICELLQENKLSAYKIAEITRLNEVSSNPIAIISAIKKRRLWTNISSSYQFPEGRHDRIFNDDQIYYICSLLESNPSISSEEILSSLNIIPETNEEYRKYRNTISAIRCHRRYTYIYLINSIYNNR